MGVGTRQVERPVVIVAGSDDVGSAIARTLHGGGMAVVLVDAADPPWGRRGMSYTDAWYVGGATLEGVDACFCGSVKSLPAVLARGDMIAATTWSPEGVARALRPLALVETRPGCGMTIARSRPALLDGVAAIGVRTTQVAGWRADVVIAAGHPRNGRSSCGEPGPALGMRIEAPHAGRFRTRREIAERIEVGDVLGELGGFSAIAPIAGVLTALPARGARVAAGQTLAEIDPCGDPQRAFGIVPEARAIAQRVGAAIRQAIQASRRPPAAAAADRLELPA
jgi:hypothetical protein